MKLKAKLALEYVNPLPDHMYEEDDRAFNAFIAGFEKAREMAAARTHLIEDSVEIFHLGEEEVG